MEPGTDGESSVVIVGGGLAGLAAAVALVPRGFQVTLLEARPRWGGRASSFVDQATGESIDNCQHVALGCCTSFLEFCRTVGIDGCFRRETRLTFIADDGTASTLSAARLPAPLHLAPAFARLRFLSWRDKRRLARGLWTLARTDPAATGDESFLSWLERHNQTPVAIERFWHVVLVSALSETLDRIDVGHARKVFVDGFLRNRSGWEVWLPTAPLDELYGTQVERWLTERGVIARRQAGVRTVTLASSGDRVSGVELRSGGTIPAEHVILAVPQNLVAAILPTTCRALPGIAALQELETAPISSVHLWFDRPITDLPHATLVGRLSQWLFNRTKIQGGGHDGVPSTGRDVSASGHYYQVVISASRDVAQRPQEETIRAVVAELQSIWPAARAAQLTHARLITEHKAVLSMQPGADRLRPTQATAFPGLTLAGDWTQTGWPGTMEGAVRSGYLAAEAVLAAVGRPASLVPADLPTAWLSRLLFGL